MSNKSFQKLNYFFTEKELVRVSDMPDEIKAITIIGRVYAERLDKSGNAESGHFVRVSKCLDNEEERIVALLHDIIEDEKATLEDLRNLDFSEQVLEAIQILSRNKELYPNYEDYITMIIKRENIIALRVKLFDMLDNSSPLRIKDLDEVSRRKAVQKYKSQIPRIVLAIKTVEYENLERKRKLA